MATIENNAVIIFDNGERKNVQSTVEQIRAEISGVTMADVPLIKVTETDGEVVLINANHIREVQQYGPPERQPPAVADRTVRLIRRSSFTGDADVSRAAPNARIGRPAALRYGLTRAAHCANRSRSYPATETVSARAQSPRNDEASRSGSTRCGGSK
jgi:hypothetical protein